MHKDPSTKTKVIALRLQTDDNSAIP